MKRRPLKKVSAGDMNKLISLFRREIVPAGYNEAAISEQYTKIGEVWAKLETRDNSGAVMFAGVEVGQGATHTFTIRFRPGVTSETMIGWGGMYYEIIDVTDWEERHEYLLLKCHVKGDKTLEAVK